MKVGLDGKTAFDVTLEFTMSVTATCLRGEKFFSVTQSIIPEFRAKARRSATRTLLRCGDSRKHDIEQLNKLVS